MRAVQKTPEEFGFSPPLEKNDPIRVSRNWTLLAAFLPLPVRLRDALFQNGLQRTALPDSLKTDKTDDSPAHCFQLVDYFPNRVRPHVPVEDPT
jgi:hypothetical protein